MRNEKLIAAREDRGWSQALAAEKIGVSRVAYARWEEQGLVPRLWAITRAREAFNMSAEQLGFRKYPSSTSAKRSLMRASSAHFPEVADAGTTSALVRVGASALSLAQQMYGFTNDELLLSIEQELRRLDAMRQQHPEKNRTRREALEFLIDLPLAVMGLNVLGESKAPLLIEEILPAYVTAVPACWRLYFDGGIAEVELALSHYLAPLSTFAQQSTRFQKLAAHAASQAYQLSWLLALQHQDFGSALTAIKQAFSYGDIADDNHLRLASLVRQAHVYFHLKRPLQQLQLHEKAIPYSSDVTPLLQGWFYVVLAESQAHLGQEEEAKQSLSRARDCFPLHPEDDPHFSYVPVDHFFFVNHEVLTQLHLNQPKQAWERLTFIDKSVPKTIVPRRVELLNRQADTSLKLGDLEQTRTYVELAGTSALQLGSDLRFSEASETYQQMQLKWPYERSVKALAELFQQD
jgi:transcriptional regulator with XRE-family HTH domain